MKQSARISIFILSALTGSLAQSMVSGPIFNEDTSIVGRTDRNRYYWAVDSGVYTPGGVTCTYPVGLFSVAPTVVAQVEVPAPTADTTFIAIVSGNSTTDVTIMVYKIVDPGTGVTMAEATLSDNVSVYLYAVGPL